MAATYHLKSYGSSILSFLQYWIESCENFNMTVQAQELTIYGGSKLVKAFYNLLLILAL